MASLIGALRVTLGADTARFEAGMKRSRTTAQQSASAIQKSLGGIQRSLANLGANLGLTFGTAGLVLAARGFLKMADEAKGMAAQLRLATATFGSFNKAQEDTRRLAVETRNGIGEITSLYGNFMRATQAVGGTQEEASRATETFSKALKIGGADANAAASATLQFGQALASGALRGDEFNSIAEASPRILQLVADAMGVSRGEVRALAAEGKITSDVLFKALTDRKFTGAIDAEFSQLPVTFDEAMQQVKNASIITFGAFDQGGEFSTALANFVTGGSDGFADLGARAEELGIDIRSTFEGLQNVFEPMLAGAQSVFGAIGIEIQNTRDSIANLFGLYDQVKNRLNVVRKGEFSIAEKMGLISAPEPSNLKGEFLEGYNASAARLRSRAAQRRSSGVGSSAAAPGQKTTSGKNGKAGPKGKSAEQLAKEAERARKEALRDEYQFNSDRRRNQIEILRAEAQQILNLDDRLEKDLAILALEAEQERAAIDHAVKMGDLTQVRADQLLADEAILAKLEEQKAIQDKTTEDLANRAKLEDMDLDLRAELLQGEADRARTAAERRAVELRLLDLAFEEERKTIERLRLTGDPQDAAEADLLASGLDARRSEAESAVLRGTMGPMAAFLDSLPRTAAEANEALEAIAANGMQSLIDGLSDAISGARSLADVFKNVAKSIVADLIRIQLQKAVVGALGGGGIFSGLLGGGGGAPPGFGTSGGKPIYAGSFAKGGSFRVGGMAGVDKNLVSMHLSKGERVDISPANQRQSPVRVIVDHSPALVARIVAGDQNAALAGAAAGQAGIYRRAGKTIP